MSSIAITPLECVGSGGFATVCTVLIGDKIRAVKSGVLGPLETTIAVCGSKYIPKYIYSTDTDLYTSFLPNSVDRNPKEAMKLVKFLCEALDDVSKKYGRTIVHGDIKLENIRVNKSGKYRLIDWGIAAFEGDEQRSADSLFFSPLGTSGMMPPEAYSPSNLITQKFDSWAIGVVIYQMLTGEVHPLYQYGGSVMSLDFQIAAMGQDDDLDFQKSFCDKLKEKLEKVVCPDGENPVLLDVMKGLLESNPEKRLSPSEAYAMVC